MADVNPAQNRASRRAAGRSARRFAALGSGAVLATGAVAALVGAMPSAGAATTIVVANTNNTGPGSLRQAVADAAPGDTIDLTGLSGTILLTSGQIDINKAVTITGPGASALTVSGNDASRVFSSNADLSGGTLTISGISIAHGNGGPGAGLFFNCRGGSGSLTLDSVSVTGNVSTSLGGGLYFDRCDAGGSMLVSNSVVSGNSTTSGGGGIWFDEGDALTITNSTVSDNSAETYSGGGVIFDNGGTFTMIDSTVSGNSSVSHGGGITVNTPTAVSLIANSTITGNSVTADRREGNGGGVSLVTGDLTIAQSTISGNTAEGMGDGLYIAYGVSAGAARSNGIGNQGTEAPHAQANGVTTATIDGTIIAANADGTDDIDGGAKSASAVVTGSVIGLVQHVPVTDGGGNQNGVTNPGLAPLANNGGATQTMALLTGSPAIDAGPATVATFPGNEFDQRGTGFARVANGRVDVGAFEVQVIVPEPIDIAPKFTG